MLCFLQSVLSQDKKTLKKTDSISILKDSIKAVKTNIYNPLAPSKAAFYSAVLPGLGQAYNKKYWKIPIIYAALGTGVYFYINNNDKYHRYRDAYKRRLAGYNDDEFYGVDANGNALSSPNITLDGLQEAQKFYKRNKELSILITVGLYALNIIEANVNAHLLQFNIDDDLSIRPYYNLNEFNRTSTAGLKVNFNF